MKVVPPVGFLYAYINYLEVKRLGKPLYFFWTWEDYTSVVILLGMVTSFMGVFYGLDRLTRQIKRGVKGKQT